MRYSALQWQIGEDKYSLMDGFTNIGLAEPIHICSSVEGRTG
ncbi:hypothetical protein [uncultured Parabacteroides sp.]|nr:hypothetical protein [uncultured Parabacteroides sp.]